MIVTASSKAVYSRWRTNWYGQGPTPVEICSDTAVWYHNGRPAVPLRWVLIRDPQGIFETKA